MAVRKAQTGGKPSTGARRTAAEIRSALVAAARTEFAKSGYDLASVRDIAAAAGLQASLINRYFGSKEALFRAVLSTSLGPAEVRDEQESFAAGPALFARNLAQRVSAPTSWPMTERVQILALALRSTGSEVARGIIAEDLDARFVGPLACQLEGPDAELRAAVISAVVMGVSLARDHIRLNSIAGVTAEQVASVIEPLFALLVRASPAPDGNVAAAN